jgi:hypothetical protein
MSAIHEEVEPNLSMPECLDARKQGVAEGFTGLLREPTGKFNFNKLQIMSWKMADSGVAEAFAGFEAGAVEEFLS